MGYILATGNRDYVLVDRPRAYEQPAQADRRQDSPHQRGPGVPRQGLSEGLSADRGRGAGAGRRRIARRWSCSAKARKGPRGRPKNSSAGTSCSANSSPAAMPSSRKRRRWPTGSATPAISIQSSRRRIDWNSGSGFCRRAGASGSSARRNRPKGLAAFLGRITGVALITQKVQQFRDATRYRAFLAQKKELAERQQRETAAFERKLELETLTMQRRLAGAGTGRAA